MEKVRLKVGQPVTCIFTLGSGYWSGPPMNSHLSIGRGTDEYNIMYIGQLWSVQPLPLFKTHLKAIQKLRMDEPSIFFQFLLIIISSPIYISTYINTKMFVCVCVCVCVFAFFSAIWNPIGISFGTKLPYASEMVLKQ